MTAVKAGSATITVTTVDGNYTARCYVTIIAKETENYLSFTANADNSSLALYNYGGNAPVLFYSRDQTNWTLWDYSKLSLNTLETVYFRGDNPNGFSQSGDTYSKFVMKGAFTAAGNVMSLLYSSEISNKTVITQNYCFYRLFSGCVCLWRAPELPATTLAENCYSSMFSGCTGLTTAPSLPATTLESDCYFAMFCGCTLLTTAPELPATTLAERCYSYMFFSCTSLTTAPSLPATILATRCYEYMFLGCSQLNYVKMMATDISAVKCLYDWLSGVSLTGTFVKNKDAIWNVSGKSGIPEGWTVVTE